MSALLDSSILVAALSSDESSHDECLALVREGRHFVYFHALLETFCALTGGRRHTRVDAALAAAMIERTVCASTTTIELAPVEAISALHTARSLGVRGGAVYDFMHLVAARKAGAKCIYTLNLSDFEAIRREGDPLICSPHRIKS